MLTIFLLKKWYLLQVFFIKLGKMDNKMLLIIILISFRIYFVVESILSKTYVFVRNASVILPVTKAKD